nr:PREDICTED: GDP-Man:Man(3)GlcNAc(2)-PP-Dol alpha-1,2-mannosyltransferase [Bemisia tabaci]
MTLFSYILFFVLTCCCIFVGVFVGLLLFAKLYFKRRKLLASGNPGVSVGFFHPYCNAGAGGERVLWCAVLAVRNKFPDAKIVIYTGDIDASPQDILKRTEQRFNMKVPETVEFVYLQNRKWVESKMYPVFTLLGQSLGSVILGFEAIYAFLPDIYIDTMGYAFTMPLFSYLGGCKVASYTHYPVITSDMLKRVSRRVKSYNNESFIARSPFLSNLKIIYYRIFSWIYSFVGRSADVIMVNSSWTEGHINSLWCCPLKTFRVYPPCDVEDLKLIPLSRDANKEKRIVSIGQFRPEKDHVLQIKTMFELRQILPTEVWSSVKLVLVGSTRNKDDEAYLKDIKDLCLHCSVEDNVEFKINVSYTQLKAEYEKGFIGLHTMWNEHFGIGIVECMAAGLIMVAHESGGPKLDIIETSDTSRNGFLATDEREYAQCIKAILCSDKSYIDELQRRARSSTDRFSTQRFNESFLQAIEFLFPSNKKS